MKKSNKNVNILTIFVVVVIAAIIIWGVSKELSKNDIAAIVNGEEIAVEEIDKLYELYQGKISKNDILTLKINEMVLVQKANELNYNVEESEIQDEIDSLIETSGISKEELISNIEAQGITTEEFEQDIHKQILLQKLLEGTVYSEIEVTEEEVLDYYNLNVEGVTAKEGEIRVRYILVETKEEAEEIIKSLEEGASFIELKLTKSLDTSNLGEGYGFISKGGNMIPTFEDTAFALEIGDVSEPVETSKGFYIIKREEDVISFQEIKNEIKDNFLESRKSVAVQDYVSSLKEQGNIEILYEFEEE